jgi:hypothetical protein
MIQKRPLAVSYVLTVLKQNKSQVSHRPTCSKATKGSLQIVSWTHFHHSRKPRVLFTTLLLESQTSLQTGWFPSIIVTPWRSHKSMQGPMYNLTTRVLNLPQTVTYLLPILKIQATCSTGTLISVYKPIQHHVSVDYSLNCVWADFIFIEKFLISCCLVY